MTDKRKIGMKSLAEKYLQIFIVVTSYWIVSISMVFLNKKLLSSKDINLNAPLFITCFQCLVSALICLAAAGLSSVSSNFKNICGDVKLEFKPQTLISVLPLSIIFVAMITFNNLCLKYVGVAFYFVGRSLTTVFNVALTYVILGQKTSLPAVLCCLVIIFGFFLGVDQEGSDGSSLSVSGVVYGVLASLFVSLNAIHTKKVLPIVSNSVWILNFYNNVNSNILLFILMVITGEISTIFNYDQISSTKFWSLMSLSGFFGFAIGFVTGLQIQVTSPLTHNISGTAKAAVQTVMAVIYFHEVKTFLWWFSNLTVIGGTAAYTRVKQIEMQKDHDRIRRFRVDDIKLTNGHHDDEEILLESVDVRPETDDDPKEHSRRIK